MRIHPDGTLVAATAGYGEPAATRRLRIEVRDLRTPGLDLVTELPAGHDPRWLSIGQRTLYARSPDGQDVLHGGTWPLFLKPANQGDLDACNGRVALSDRTTLRCGDLSIPSAFEPSLSPGGTLAMRDMATGVLRIDPLHGSTDPFSSGRELGPGTRLRRRHAAEHAAEGDPVPDACL